MEHKITSNTVTVDLRPKQLTKEEAEQLIKVKEKQVKKEKQILK